jgi:hypothetical protein
LSMFRRPFTTWSDRRARGGLTSHHEEVTPIKRQVGPAGSVFWKIGYLALSLCGARDAGRAPDETPAAPIYHIGKGDRRLVITW